MKIKLLTAATSVAALLTGVALPSTAQSLSDLDGNALQESVIASITSTTYLNNSSY